ncbi:MAG: hypothetical protein HOJ64_02680 [Euryarchaeota archaeon]|nr:hypothetical protein [Euryarchaeota archaeon]
MLSKKYWVDLKEYIFESPPKYRILCLVFILLANVTGTSPMLFWMGFEFGPFLEIWTVSLLADIVFIITMTVCFFIPLRIAVNAKSKSTYFLSPMLNLVLVPIAYTFSWFFVCIGTELDHYDASPIDGTIITFLAPISSKMDLDNIGLLMFGYNGVIASIIFSAIVILINVQIPSDGLKSKS